MKKLLYMAVILMLTGCSKPIAKETPISKVMEEISENVNISSPVEEDLTIQKNAEKFGISTQSIKDGIAYYTTSKDKSDKIIIVRASSQEEVENLEQALSAELTSSKKAWKENENESTKVENALFKTRDDCIILAINENIEEIEEIFDKNL